MTATDLVPDSERTGLIGALPVAARPFAPRRGGPADLAGQHARARQIRLGRADAFIGGQGLLNERCHIPQFL